VRNSADGAVLFLRRRRKKTTPRAKRARKMRPPMTPPAISPDGALESCLGLGVGFALAAKADAVGRIVVRDTARLGFATEPLLLEDAKAAASVMADADAGVDVVGVVGG